MALPADDFAPGTALGNRPCILVGLVGANIGLSRTPAMHEREAEALGLRLCYRLFDTACDPIAPGGLGDFFRCLQRAGYRGVNITHPYKEEAVQYLDELAEPAATIGSVNTVLFGKRRRIGYNTDAPGFAAAIRESLGSIASRRVLQLGAGGAGRAIAYALLALEVEQVLVFDIDRRRSEALVARLEGLAGGRIQLVDELASAVAAADLLVHATPVGMRGHPGMAIEPTLLHAGLTVIEIVYVPRETELLRAARACGCRTIDGSGMAIHQAAAAFRLFTAHTANPARMAQTFWALEGATSQPADRGSG